MEIPVPTMQSRILEFIATGVPQSEVLRELALDVEEKLQGCFVSVLHLDRESKTLRHVAAPSLPAGYAEAIDGVVIGPAVGSCGTAAYSGKTVIVGDIQTDPLWKDFREVAGAYGLASCWSTPILSSKRTVLGTFAIYRRQPYAPSDAELLFTTRMAHLAGICMERAQDDIDAKAREEFLSAIVSDSSDSIIIVDRKETVIYMNPAAERLTGRDFQERAGQSLFSNAHPDDMGRVREIYQRVLKTPGRGERHECRIRHKDGSWIYVESLPTNMLDNPAVKGILVSSRDMTERKLAERQMLHDASHDRLTGLPDRAVFLDCLRRSLQMGSETAVLFLNLDRFRAINDALGHRVGDDLISTIAMRVTACLDPEDTFARLGSDEFAVLLNHASEAAVATGTAGRIIQAIAQPLTMEGHEIFPSASVGIALSGAARQHPEDILQDADAAMRRAKSLGRSRYALYDERLQASALARLQLEHDLRRAVGREEFAVYYEPVISLESGRLAGFEALVRWRHPVRGLLPPAQFLAMAEDTGLIVAIDSFVLDRVCRQQREWAARRPAQRPLTLSVNVSGLSFFQPQLVDGVSEALRRNGADAGSLRLEISENILASNNTLGSNGDSPPAILRRLKDLHVDVCLDDFGTGYCSLNYLKIFPVNQLKLDRSFVSKMLESSRDNAIIEAIMTLAHGLGIGVIAEGVTSHREIVALRDLGCQFAQGYYFAEPLSGVAAGELALSSLRW